MAIELASSLMNLQQPLCSRECLALAHLRPVELRVQYQPAVAAEAYTLIHYTYGVTRLYTMQRIKHPYIHYIEGQTPLYTLCRSSSALIDTIAGWRTCGPLNSACKASPPSPRKPRFPVPARTWSWDAGGSCPAPGSTFISKMRWLYLPRFETCFREFESVCTVF